MQSQKHWDALSVKLSTVDFITHRRKPRYSSPSPTPSIPWLHEQQVARFDLRVNSLASHSYDPSVDGLHVMATSILKKCVVCDHVLPTLKTLGHLEQLRVG